MNPEKAYITSAEPQMAKLKKEEGFTLIEVLVALTIFAVGLLAIAAMQTSAIRMNSNAGKLTNLSTLAMDQIEKLSALPYADSALNAGSHEPTSPSANYSISYTVTDTWKVIYSIPVSVTKNITVTVSGRGKSTNFSFLKPNV